MLKKWFYPHDDTPRTVYETCVYKIYKENKDSDPRLKFRYRVVTYNPSYHEKVRFSGIAQSIESKEYQLAITQSFDEQHQDNNPLSGLSRCTYKLDEL